MEELDVSPEDAKLAVEIFKKAISYRLWLKKAILGDELLALPKEEREAEAITPRIGLHYVGDDGSIPCLFFRFAEIRAPIIEAILYPYVAVLSFLQEARAYTRWVNPDRPDEEIERLATDRAVEMAGMMIDNFYRRGELMMDSFTNEVIAQWRIQTRQDIAQFHAERGNIMPKKKDKTLGNVVDEYAKEILEVWKSQGQTRENWRKLRLAEEYEGILKHWKLLRKLSGDNDGWRGYAKASGFEDTPDDLLGRLENTDRLDQGASENRISELAIEHAARRVGLVKKRGVGDSILEQRQRGLKVTGYTSTQLFIYLKEGRELLEQQRKAKELLAQDKSTQPLE